MVGSEPPVVILTSYSWTDIEDEAREAGVTSFIDKPLFASDLTGIFSDDAVMESAPLAVTLDGVSVLLVEDNATNTEIATFMLSEMGATITCATNGQIALELLEASEGGQHFDIILMDLQMPVMDGFETTGRIRAHESEYLKNVPIVALTADAFKEDEKRCLEVVPEATREWKPEIAPQAMVMNSADNKEVAVKTSEELEKNVWHLS